MKGIISFELIKTEFQVDPSTGLLIEPEFLRHNFAHWSKHVPDGPYNIFAAVAYFRPFFFDYIHGLDTHFTSVINFGHFK